MKIEAKELRIGNIVLWVLGHESKVVIIKSISETTCWVTDPAGGECEVDNYQLMAIPITEQWLDRLGFEKDESLLDPIDTPNGNFWVDWVKDEVIISMPYFEFSFNEGAGKTEIKYVHQLQNLYFALTGQELTLKPRI